MTATPPNRARLLLERVLRTVALVALAAAMYLASRPAARRDQLGTVMRWSVADVADSSATAPTTALVRAVVAASGDPPSRAITVEFPAVPAMRTRGYVGVWCQITSNACNMPQRLDTYDCRGSRVQCALAIYDRPHRRPRHPQ